MDNFALFSVVCVVSSALLFSLTFIATAIMLHNGIGLCKPYLDPPSSGEIFFIPNGELKKKDPDTIRKLRTILFKDTKDFN